MGYKKKWYILNTEPELQHLKMSGFFDFKPLKHRFHLQKKIHPEPVEIKFRYPPPAQHY